MDLLSEQTLPARTAADDVALSIAALPDHRGKEPAMAAVIAVMHQLPIAKPCLDERLATALEHVRPMLASHGGNVELVRVAPPMVEVRLLGTCDGCAASATTFHAGVKQAVFEACPEITDVVLQPSARGGQADELVSPFARVKLFAWHTAIDLAELDDGGARALTVDGRPLLFARQGHNVACFDNACAHRGYLLDDSDAEAGVITCTRHGLRFNLTTGVCLSVPTIGLKERPTRVIGTRVEVKLPR